MLDSYQAPVLQCHGLGCQIVKFDEFRSIFADGMIHDLMKQYRAVAMTLIDQAGCRDGLIKPLKGPIRKAGDGVVELHGAVAHGVSDESLVRSGEENGFSQRTECETSGLQTAWNNVKASGWDDGLCGDLVEIQGVPLVR